MVKIKVLLFANIRERIGKKELTLEFEDQPSVQEFKQWLGEEYPDVQVLMPTVLVAINQEYVDENILIPDGAEVAIFPSVSGGSEFPTIFKITEEELDLNQLVESITLPTTGAACVFTGMVRGETSRGQSFTTEFLEYQAYQSMAESKMRQVAEEIRERWTSVEGIAIVQRIGTLYPGTPTVLIACTAAHRDTGVFEASRYGIDRLKEIVPIWKKEVGPDGDEWIEGGYVPKPGE